MKSLKLLCVALIDTTIGLLTFNLSMNRVPHSNSSAKLAVGVTVLGAVLGAVLNPSVGKIHPALILLLPISMVAVDSYRHRRGALVPLRADEPSRAVAIAYVSGMTCIIGFLMLTGASLFLPEGFEWLNIIPGTWMLLVFMTILPRIEPYQAALREAARAPAGDEPVAAPRTDVPDSKRL